MTEGLLDGKVAIVTGAGSPTGTGHAMVLGLVQAGARVAMLDLNEEWLEQSLGHVRSIGGDGCAVPLLADITDPDAVERAVQQTLDEFGGLHILINNAGTNPRSAGFELKSRNFWDIPLAAWDRVVQVNMNGAFYMSRAVIGHLRAQGWGRIIGVTTSVDTMFGKRRVPYGPSKAGHEALVASMAAELEGSGITANILVPGGPANTGFLAYKSDAEKAALIQPEVMAPPAVWLASEASHACNGRRIIACRWDTDLPPEECLDQADAPAAWPQLGKQAVMPPK